VAPAVNRIHSRKGIFLPMRSERAPIGTIVNAIVIEATVRITPTSLEFNPRLFVAKRGTRVLLTPVLKKKSVNTAKETMMKEEFEKTCRMSRRASFKIMGLELPPELSIVGKDKVGIIAIMAIIAYVKKGA
jgi:hypothetical protein